MNCWVALDELFIAYDIVQYLCDNTMLSENIKPKTNKALIRSLPEAIEGAIANPAALSRSRFLSFYLTQIFNHRQKPKYKRADVWREKKFQKIKHLIGQRSWAAQDVCQPPVLYSPYKLSDQIR